MVFLDSILVLEYFSASIVNKIYQIITNTVGNILFSVDVAVNLVLPVANLQLWIIPKVAWTMEDMRETAKTNKELSTVIR